MNAILRLIAVAVSSFVLAIALPSPAQVVPTTPKGFKMRPLGETGASAGIATAPKASETTYRQVTYIALSPSRQWKSADGKSLLGKLIAFEDIVVETKNAAPDLTAKPVMPPSITVVRDGRARLLVNQKPFEVALDRLGEDERALVKAIDDGVKAKAKAPATKLSPYR